MSGTNSVLLQKLCRQIASRNSSYEAIPSFPREFIITHTLMANNLRNPVKLNTSISTRALRASNNNAQHYHYNNVFVSTCTPTWRMAWLSRDCDVKWKRFITRTLFVKLHLAMRFAITPFRADFWVQWINIGIFCGCLGAHSHPMTL